MAFSLSCGYPFWVRILYLQHSRFPTEKAHGRQVAAVCTALAEAGHSVKILAPSVRNPVAQDAATYYGLPSNVSVTHLSHFDATRIGILPEAIRFPLTVLSYRRALKKFLCSLAQKADLLYLRSPLLLSTAITAGIPVVLELHSLPGRGRARFVQLCNRCRLVVCLTTSMREELVTLGVDASRVIVEGDAVDLRLFAQPLAQEEARSQLGFSTKKFVVGYVGRLKTMEMEKGVEALLEALVLLQSDGSFFGLIVGGPEDDRLAYEARAHALNLTSADVCFLGEVPPSQVPMALWACDALAMPFPDLPHYRTNMSPLKMFEYMAASRPIVTSDLPTIRDVLSEESATFCNPGDAQSLKKALEEVRARPLQARERADRAFALVQRHTWAQRMERILMAATQS